MHFWGLDSLGQNIVRQTQTKVLPTAVEHVLSSAITEKVTTLLGLQSKTPPG